METAVQLSKGDIDGHVSSEKKAVQSEASEIISGYRKGKKSVPEGVENISGLSEAFDRIG